MVILCILGFSLLGSIGAIAGAALLLAVPAAVRDKLIPLLISYATGTLLGTAFLGMIPAGLQQVALLLVGITTIALPKAACG
jgi:zinc and cadmium transporter